MPIKGTSLDVTTTVGKKQMGEKELRDYNYNFSKQTPQQPLPADSPTKPFGHNRADKRKTTQKQDDALQKALTNDLKKQGF